MLDQSKAPLLEQMIKHAKQNTKSFHVPGHKSGRTYESSIAYPYFASIMPLDLTEITGLDDLHDPNGVILEAQSLAAELFGADYTSFLVGGSTSGNLAMILSLCNPGDVMIVDREVHKSVIHGLMLAKAKAVFIDSAIDPNFGVPKGMRIDMLEAAIQQYPEAKAVLLTNPNYYGLGQQLKPIVEIAHRFGMPVLVDEAHGAHYGFHPRLPDRALSEGADAVVQSPHKMLTAMTMSGMLHIKGDRVNYKKTARALSMIQSSSPSYPILASMDWTRKVLAEQGYELISKGLEAVDCFRNKMRALHCFSLNSLDVPSPYTQDPFKILIKDNTGTLNGRQLQEELEKRGCFMEMSQSDFVLAVFTLASTLEDAEHLYLSLKDIQEKFDLNNREFCSSSNGKNDERTDQIYGQQNNNRPHVPPAIDFGFHDSEEFEIVELAIDEAVGRRSYRAVTPYPPGVPILFPGEWITEHKVTEIKRLLKQRVNFQGLRINGNVMIETY